MPKKYFQRICLKLCQNSVSCWGIRRSDPTSPDRYSKGWEVTLRAWSVESHGTADVVDFLAYAVEYPLLFGCYPCFLDVIHCFWMWSMFFGCYPCFLEYPILTQTKLSPKSIPNSEKQKQLPNTQWVKYVYCPALFTLEVGRARCNHSTNTLWKNAFPKAFAILWPICPKLVHRVFFPKNCYPPHSSLHLPNIHHPHLLCPLHHL